MSIYSYNRGQPSGSAQVPIFDTVNGQPRRVSMAELANFVALQMQSEGYSLVLNTVGIPSDSIGVDGQLAVDADAGVIYLKSDGHWALYSGGGGTPAPVFTEQPSITGISQVGQVLNAIDGSASNTTTLLRQWYIDGVEVDGANGPTYTPVLADVGKTPGLRNFAFGPGGGPVYSDLAESDIVSAEPVPLSISGTPASSVTVGAVYSFTPVAAGGSPPRTFALIAGTLPAGLSFSTSTGSITGTPTTTGTATGLSIRVTDSVAATADLPPFSITVSAAVADSRARYGVGSATAGVSSPEALLASMTVMTGASNGSKAGSFNTTGAVPSGQYGWAAFEAAASASGVVFTEPLGTGGWQGASYPGNNADDPNVSPNTSTVTAVISGVTWRFFRQNYANAGGQFTTS